MSGSNGSELYPAVASRGSEHVFPNNCGNSFTNILAEKINLDPNIRHEVGLVSHHMPAYGAVLHKDDVSAIFYVKDTFLISNEHMHE